MNLSKEDRSKQRKEMRGSLWYLLQKTATPEGRYLAIINMQTAVMSEGGGLHGNCKYFGSADPEHYIRLQVIESTKSYLKIHASLVAAKDAEIKSEKLGFGALFGNSPEANLIGVASSVEEIDEFLDSVWQKWKWRKNPNLGSKWTKTSSGFRRNSDGKIFSSTKVKFDGAGWYTIELNGEFIVFSSNDLSNE